MLFFAPYVRLILIEKDMLQKDLAEMLDVNASLISYWISGERSTSCKLVKRIVEHFTTTEEEKRDHLFFIFFGGSSEKVCLK